MTNAFDFQIFEPTSIRELFREIYQRSPSVRKFLEPTILTRRRESYIDRIHQYSAPPPWAALRSARFDPLVSLQRSATPQDGSPSSLHLSAEVLAGLFFLLLLHLRCSLLFKTIHGGSVACDSLRSSSTSSQRAPSAQPSDPPFSTMGQLPGYPSVPLCTFREEAGT